MSEVFGIDFSGGKQAGRKVWVARAEAVLGGVHVLDVRPGCDLPGSGVAVEACMPALRALIEAHPEATFGIDAPFGLHGDLFAEPDWPRFLAGFAARYVDAKAFRDDYRARSGGKEWWRPTDKEAKVPFTGYNLRVHRQTFHALKDVLAPLVAEDRARVRPMQRPAPGRATVVEVCPASTLKRAGLYGSYKDKKNPPVDRREARRTLVAALCERFGLRFADAALADRLVSDPEGDALDAVVCAIATERALHVDDAALGAYGREGYVYV